MKASLQIQALRSGNRWVVFCAVLCLHFLVSCSAVSNQVDRYESNYQQEYGAAIQDQNNPGLIHCEDEYVLMNLVLQPKGAMAFQIMNKTDGGITINWNEVMYDVPRTGLVQAVSAGAQVLMIPPKKGVQTSFTPYQPLSLFPEDYEVSGRNPDGTHFAYQGFSVRMPMQVETVGGRKLYVFVYSYSPGQGFLSGACNSLN